MSEFALEEGIGRVAVRIEGDTIWMSHRDAEFGPPLHDRTAIAAALSLSEADLLPDQPVRSGSTGVRFLYVPLTSREAVDRAEANLRELARVYGGERLGVFVFAPDGPARVYSRMFAGDTLGHPRGLRDRLGQRTARCVRGRKPYSRASNPSGSSC